MIQIEGKELVHLARLLSELDKAIIQVRKYPTAETNEEQRVRFRNLIIHLLNACQGCKLKESARLCDQLYQRLADPFAHHQAWSKGRQRPGPKIVPPRSFSALDEDFCEIGSRIAEELEASRFTHPPSEGSEKLMERIERKLEAFAQNGYELQKENEELKRLLSGRYLKIISTVDPEDFKAFVCILALGNRKAASDQLRIPHRTFYDRVASWESRGRAYQSMFRLVEWRKKIGGKIKLRLDDSLQSGEPSDRPENPKTIRDVISQSSSRDYPTILRQILQELMEQTPENCVKIRDELIELIKDELAQ